MGDALRGAKMFEQVGVPVLGVVENMSYYVCPHCGEQTELFLAGGGQRLADELASRCSARSRSRPDSRALADRGQPIVVAAARLAGRPGADGRGPQGGGAAPGRAAPGGRSPSRAEMRLLAAALLLQGGAGRPRAPARADLRAGLDTLYAGFFAPPRDISPACPRETRPTRHRCLSRRRVIWWAAAKDSDDFA